MGLDTVELVVAFEKHFQLEIPDPVAEEMSSVGDVAAWVGQQLGADGRRGSAVRDSVAVALQQLLAADVADASKLPLVALLPNRQAYQDKARQLLANHGLRLVIPDFLPRAHGNGWLLKFLGPVTTASPTAPPDFLLADLVDWTVAFNYEKLLQIPLASQYDVEQAVIGITADKSGVDIPEIKLSSRFTYDLGMD